MSQTQNPYNTRIKKRTLPDPIRSILSNVLKKHGLEDKIAKYDFVLYWEQIVGVEIAKRTKPLQIKNGVLTVAVQNSIWAQELSYNKKMIINKLSERLKSTSILKDIHFNVVKDF